MADRVLRQHINFLGVCKYDWVHTFLSDGALSASVWQMISFCETNNIATQADLATYLKEDWEVPRTSLYSTRDPRKLHALFDAVAAPGNKEAEAVRCSASELLCLYGVLDFWVTTCLPEIPILAKPRACFSNICRAVSLLLRVKRGAMRGPDVAPQIRELLKEHLRLFQELYGADLVRPKHHWGFDVVDQIERGGYIMDAFIIERLHLRARGVADFAHNLGKYSQAVQAGLLNAQAHAARVAKHAEGLIGKTAQLQHATVGDIIQVAGNTIAVGSAVQNLERGMGMVIACVEEEGDLGVLVTPMAEVAAKQGRARYCKVVGDVAQLWPVRGTDACLAWKTNVATGVTVALVLD